MPSNQFSSYSRTEKWMKLADKKTNTVAETYTHSQSYTANYKNGVAQNFKAKESYDYDIQGPSSRVKEKKSAGFDGSRAANGKIEGEAWRHKTDGFSDETFNNGFNVGNRLESPFADRDGFGLESGGFGPLLDDNTTSFRDGFRTALFGTDYGDSTVSTAANLGSQPARPLGVDYLREEGAPASYADFTPWREDSLPPSSGPNRMYPSRAISRNNSRFSTSSNSTLGPRDSASQRPRFV